VLSLLTRKPKPLANTGDKASEPLLRKRQQNIKVTEDCAVTFAALAEAQGMSKAALFEDMVAERLETLQRQGLELGILKR
jgi:hypothetical protein